MRSMLTNTVYKARITRHVLAGLLLAVGLAIAVPQTALAVDPVYTSFWNKRAVGGYDAVAYFTQGKPVKGKAEFSMKYKGVEWRFSSKENLEKFKADPTKYAPQYGGYCAWAIAAKGDAVKGDPKYWRIVNGKLYLNYDADI
jgi:YHS domain-containing protein